MGRIMIIKDFLVLSSERDSRICVVHKKCVVKIDSKSISYKDILIEYLGVPKEVADKFLGFDKDSENAMVTIQKDLMTSRCRRRMESTLPNTRMNILKSVVSAGYAFLKSFPDGAVFTNPEKNSVLFVNYATVPTDYYCKLTIRKDSIFDSTGQPRRKYYHIRNDGIELLENGSIPSSLTRFLSF